MSDPIGDNPSRCLGLYYSNIECTLTDISRPEMMIMDNKSEGIGTTRARSEIGDVRLKRGSILII